MRPEPRPELLHMPDPIHGALDFAELDRLELAPEAVLDFSVNGNCTALHRACVRLWPRCPTTATRIGRRSPSAVCYQRIWT